MHTAHPKIPNRSHAQVLLAAGAKRALRGAHGRANIGQIHRPVAVRGQYFLKAIDDCSVVSPSGSSFRGDLVRQAGHERVDELIFHGD